MRSKVLVVQLPRGGTLCLALLVAALTTACGSGGSAALDAALPDAAAHDAVGLEAAADDAAGLDAAADDAAGLDAAADDAATDDAAGLDAAGGDGALPDAAVSDGAMPDGPTADGAVLDALTFDADAVAPTATVSPANGLLLHASSPVVIRFSETMSTSSLALGGTLDAESNGGVWSATVTANDTLTVSPSGGAWTQAIGHTLTVAAEDVAGNPLSPLALTFDVAVGTFYYVHAAVPDDTGDGLSPIHAKRTVAAAIAAATPPASVLVAQGSYDVNTTLSTDIVMREGVSLYGGHSSDFTARNFALFTSTVTDGATAGGTVSAPNRVVSAGAGITPATVINGLTIVGGGGTYSSGIRLVSGTNANPRIQGNSISGGSGNSSMAISGYGGSGVIVDNTLNGGSAGQYSYGVFINAAGAAITGNRIHGGSGGTASSALHLQSNGSALVVGNVVHGGTGPVAYGVSINSGTTITLRNNLIYAGSGTTRCVGIRTYGTGYALIENNTIDAGGAPQRYGIQFNGTAGTVGSDVRNNLVFSSGGAATCVAEGTAPCTPREVRNNDFNCSTVYHDTELGCAGSGTCSLAQLEALTDISGGVSGNVAVSPQLADADGPDNDPTTMADNDWHLTATSPLDVRGGGLSLAGITEDFDRAARTTTTPTGMTNADATGWSIGAFERD